MHYDFAGATQTEILSDKAGTVKENLSVTQPDASALGVAFADGTAEHLHFDALAKGKRTYLTYKTQATDELTAAMSGNTTLIVRFKLDDLVNSAEIEDDNWIYLFDIGGSGSTRSLTALYHPASGKIQAHYLLDGETSTKNTTVLVSGYDFEKSPWITFAVTVETRSGNQATAPVPHSF